MCFGINSSFLSANTLCRSFLSVLSSIDFTLCIVNSDDDSMAKAKKKLGQRLILAALLFFVPTISMALLDIFGITADPTCGIG